MLRYPIYSQEPLDLAAERQRLRAQALAARALKLLRRAQLPGAERRRAKRTKKTTKKAKAKKLARPDRIVVPAAAGASRIPAADASVSLVPDFAGAGVAPVPDAGDADPREV